MTNYFGEHISRFFNESQNPSVKLEFIKSSFSYITNYISKNKKLPNINDISQILSSLDYSIYKFYNSLLKTEIENGISISRGYNTVSIQSLTTSFDIDLYLTNLSPSNIQTYSDIYTIYNNCNQDLNLYKCLSFMCNNNSTNYINYFLQYNPKFNPFYYIHNCNPYEIPYSYENIAVFPFIYQYVYLLRCFEISSNFTDLLSDTLLSSLKYNKNQLLSYFENYININNTNILNRFSEYFYKNILLLGKDISNSFKMAFKNILSGSISELINIFKNCLDVDIILNDLSVSIIYDSIMQTYSYTTFKYLHDSIYSFDNIYFTFSDNYQFFILDEENIKKQILNWMIENQSQLNYLEFLSFKFKEKPLFFINSHYSIHTNLIDYLYNNMSILYNLSDYLSKISVTDNNIQNIITFINNNGLIFTEDIISYTSIIYFKKLINSFINSNEFMDWIMTSFCPKLDISVKSIYPIELDIYKYIDDIKLLFNIIFVDDIINDKFFPDYISNMKTDFNSNIQNVIVYPNLNDKINSSLTTIINSTFMDNKYLQNIINNFFRSSIVSKYLEGILATHSI